MAQIAYHVDHRNHTSIIGGF